MRILGISFHFPPIMPTSGHRQQPRLDACAVRWLSMHAYTLSIGQAAKHCLGDATPSAVGWARVFIGIYPAMATTHRPKGIIALMRLAR